MYDDNIRDPSNVTRMIKYIEERVEQNIRHAVKCGPLVQEDSSVQGVNNGYDGPKDVVVVVDEAHELLRRREHLMYPTEVGAAYNAFLTLLNRVLILDGDCRIYVWLCGHVPVHEDLLSSLFQGRVAMRTLSAKHSTAIIGVPDAAAITAPNTGYVTANVYTEGRTPVPGSQLRVI